MTDAAPITFNPLEDGFIDWPYGQYRRLRAEQPVHHSDLLHGWVVTRYRDVDTLLRDPTISSEIDNAAPTALTMSEIERRDQSTGGRTLVLLDDPDHGRLRKLVAKPFRPKEIEKFQQLIRDRVSARVDALVDEYGSGSPVEFDLIGDFAYPLPVEIFCQMLGIPDEDTPIFRQWVNGIARNLDPVMDAEERERLRAEFAEMMNYLEELVASKRKRDDDDVLSDLIHAEEDGEVLTHEELLAQVITLYVRGPRTNGGSRRQRHARVARVPGPVEAAARRPVTAAQRGGRAVALRRPEPIRAPHRDARHAVRHAVGPGHHPCRRGRVRVAGLSQPRRDAVGSNGRRRRHPPR